MGILQKKTFACTGIRTLNLLTRVFLAGHYFIGETFTRLKHKSKDSHESRAVIVGSQRCPKQLQGEKVATDNVNHPTPHPPPPAIA